MIKEKTKNIKCMKMFNVRVHYIYLIKIIASVLIYISFVDIGNTGKLLFNF
jgi:hypothetical protein